MNDKMNNKGFTLIELLATIVILGIVASITIVAVTSYYESSKKKAEEVFIGQTEKYISDYISLRGSDLGFVSLGDSKYYYKCHIVYVEGVEVEEVCKEVVLSYYAASIENVAFSVVKGDLINPSTEKKCTDDNTQLSIYRDNDYVYCFRLEPKEGTTACISKKIDTCSNIFVEK